MKFVSCFPTALGVAAVLACAQPHFAQAALIVDLQGSTDWVSSQQNSARTGTTTTGDYGSGSAVDIRNVIAFNTSTPMFTSAQINVQSSKFYGGKNNTFFNNATDPSYDNRLVSGGGLGDDDRWIFGSAVVPGSGKSQSAALVALWKKEDFLNGGSANQVSITANNAFSTQIGSQVATIFLARWMVQIGSTYYVSNENFALNSSLVGQVVTSTSITTTTWAPIDFTANSGDMTAVPGAYGSLALDNINAVGVYASFPSTVNNSNARITLEAFSVNAAVIPEPSTAVLLGCGLLGTFLLRRRGRQGA